MKRLLYFSSDPLGVPCLEYIIQQQSALGFKCIGVVTQPDKTVGRGLLLKSNVIGKFVKKQNDLPLFQPKNSQELLQLPECDLGILVAYGKLIPQALLDAIPQGIINLHASLLPKYRGASPIAAAILNGDSFSGMTLMKLSSKMDEGPISPGEKVLLDPNETQESLREKLAIAGKFLLQRTLPDLLANRLQFILQEESLASYTSLLSKETGHLNFQLSAERLERQVRALYPWPGSFFYYQNQAIRTTSVTIEDLPFREKLLPGSVVESSKKLKVASATKLLVFHNLQKPGGKLLATQDFLNGFSIPKGVVL